MFRVSRSDFTTVRMLLYATSVVKLYHSERTWLEFRIVRHLIDKVSMPYQLWGQKVISMAGYRREQPKSHCDENI